MDASERPNALGGFQRTPNRPLYEMSEHELVREILFGSTRLYEFLSFVMTDVHGLKSEDGWEYLFFGNVPRTDLGLPRLGQPGDIDVMIIPHRDGELHIGKTAAVEVKRLSLKAPRWDKSTDRIGVTQAKGLLDAGFPYVGILHLIVHDTGPAENHRSMLAARVVGHEGRISFEGDSITDMTGSISARRQLGRLLAHQPDPAIGLNCVWLSDVEVNGEKGVSVGMPHGRIAKLNPKASSECLQNILAFVRQMATREP